MWVWVLDTQQVRAFFVLFIVMTVQDITLIPLLGEFNIKWLAHYRCPGLIAILP